MKILDPMDPRGKTPNPAPKRSRMLISRARTGCLTCKTRRVKCDEQKPVCKRCIAAKRHCAGYQKPPSNPPKPFRITYYVRDLPSSIRALHRPLEDPQDQRALDYFFLWGNAYFPSDLMEPLSRDDILYEPALRHAMIAMGRLHEIYRNGEVGASKKVLSVFAMQHYGEAIRRLVLRDPDTASDPSPVFLVACFLFVCLESSQGHVEAALRHLRSGFMLFQEARRSGKLLIDCEPILRWLFTRLMCQLTHFDPSDCARFFGLNGSQSKPQVTFIHLEDARIQLGNLMQKMIHRRYLTTSFGVSTGPRQQVLVADRMKTLLAQELAELDTWILAFNHYLSFGISSHDTGDYYVLAICSFLLKFRLMAESRETGEHYENDSLDLKHTLDLGRTLLSDSNIFGSPPRSTTASNCRPETQYSLNQLLETRAAGPTAIMQSHTPTNPHFLFLGILSALSVASVHAPDLVVRQQAQQMVQTICESRMDRNSWLAFNLASCLSYPEIPNSYYDTDTLYGNISAPEAPYSRESSRLIALLADLGNL
ncbi:Zn(II)2Cys6 transcription factor domain-containing protein [Aspergillus ibericus CBS 121593]|uniref:Zn(2)-C6 fungal-type domain-containing protein n=1 Tax=Aspergillus ibericus CBS 121593 TaxID=1448316 RepID=A0A395HDU5_9EURO|nr:hypothetical protein BO80DRAFT_86915 [Aspergillus ibericus CBS 121593]RAL06022.1 hypothetical protein BO80DRAFT_86915 [Aspergillus ibericus CBS 121593]